MSQDRQPNDSDHVSRLRARWDKLTEDDCAAAAARREELSGRIQARYAVAKDEADRQIADWMKEPGALDDWNDRRPILDM